MNGKIDIREARRDDRSAMLEITRNVWEGEDYVPFVWDEWLRDPAGRVWIAETEGRVVGLQHLEIQPDGTGWLEGIRVAEDMRGRGVARAMLEDSICWARKNGLPAIRLSTSTGNEASNRLVASAGLAAIGRFQFLIASPSSAVSTAPIRVASATDFEEVQEFLAKASGLVPGFYTEGWTAYRLTEERLRLLLATSALLLCGESQIEALAIATATIKRSALRLGLLVGSSAGGRSLCGRVLNDAYKSGLKEVRATLALDKDFARVLDECGFEGQNNLEMLLRELSLS